MSTLKTHNLQSPDAGSVNITLAPNAGVVVAGLSTYSNQINVGSNIKLGTAGVVTATTFDGNVTGNVTGDITISDSIIHSGDNSKIRFPSNDTITFETSGNEGVRIDAGGRLLVGTNAARTFGGGEYAHLQVEGTTQSGAQITITRNTNDTYSANLSLCKTRGTSDGAVTTVQDNDSLGTIQFRGADGSDVYAVAAAIHGEVDGSPSDGTDMPGALVFGTTPEGQASPTERLRITSGGKFGFGTNSPDQTVHIHKGSAGSVSSTANTVLTLENSTTNVLQFLNPNNTSAQIRFGDPQDDGAGFIDYSHSANTMSFGVYGPTRMQLDSNGHLGIDVASVTQLANSLMLTLRPSNGDGIRLIRPGDANNSPNVHLDLTTTTSGSAFPTGEAYTTKYKTANIDQIFETAEGGGTGGNISFRTRSSSGESLRIDPNGIVTIPHQPAFRSYTTSDSNGNGVVSGIWNTGAADKRKFDNNDDFNESNGRFTAPVDGVYQISVAWDELNTSTIIDVQINGGGGVLDLYSTEPHATSGWNTHFTGSITKLSSGDYVTINLRSASGTYPFHQNNGRWGHFSVYLIG